MSEIELFSRKISRLFQLFFFSSPIFTIIFWLWPEQMLSFGINPFPIPSQEVTVTFNGLSKLLGFGISLLPTMIVMILFYMLAKLFKNYQNGEVFSQNNISYYKKLGKYLFLLACVNFLCTGLMSVALTCQNLSGQRTLCLSIGMAQIFPILIGLVIIGISHVMNEAFRLDEEQKYTI